MIVTLGQWTPDLPDLRPEGCNEALNVLPAPGGFRSFRLPATFGSQIPDPPVKGTFWLQDEAGVYSNFCGTQDQLYRLVGQTWTAVGTGSYAAASNWQFARFGSRVIAVARGVTPQYFDLGVSSSFADLPGSPPSASTVAVVRDQVVLGATARSASPIPSGFQVIEWSGIDNSEAWGPSIRTQADVEQFFSRGGNVQRVTPGEVGYIIREHSIHRMTYVGTPVVFRFDEIAQGVGTPSRDSVCWLGQQIFFLGRDGFYMMINGQLRNIGQNRVDRRFRETCSDITDVVGAVDRRNRRIFWAFKVSASSNYDRMFCYDIDLDAWSSMEVDLTWLDEFSVPGLSLDQLDSVLPGGIDAAEFRMESEQYVGGAIQIAGFDPTGQGLNFTGDAAESEIVTREFANESGARMVIQGVTPVMQSTSSTSIVGSLGVRERQNQDVVFGSDREQVSSGEIKFRESTRFARVKLEPRGAFDHFTAVRVRLNALGGRR